MALASQVGICACRISNCRRFVGRLRSFARLCYALSAALSAALAGAVGCGFMVAVLLVLGFALGLP